MKLKFWKKESQADEKPAAEEAVIEDRDAVEEQQNEPPKPEPAVSETQIRDLLSRIAAEKDLNTGDVKLMSAAFAKAASAVLDNESLAGEETLKAFSEFASEIENTDLRYAAVARLGALAVKYPAHAGEAVGILTKALDDPEADVRHSAVFALKDIAETNADHSGAIFDTLVKATESEHQDLCEEAVKCVTGLAVANEGYADKATEILTALLAKEPSKDKARQEYKLRIDVARRLGAIALAHDSQVDKAIEALAAGLKDDEIFVRHRTIESLEKIGAKHADKVDGIVEMLEKGKEGATFVVEGKINRAVMALKPPKEPEKTPEEIAAEKKAAEEREKKIAEETAKKAAEAQAKKDAETARKERMDGIKTLANKLPGKALK